MSFATAIGYMTKTVAKAEGFTHHGSYYGIPIWVGEIETGEPLVACKWSPMWALVHVAMYIEGFLGGLFFPDDEPGFQMLIKEPIE